jgi:hypothetical protein
MNPHQIETYATILRAVQKTARVELLADGIGVVRGTARYVVGSDHEGMAHDWTDDSRLRVTTSQGFESFVRIGDIEEIEITEQD